MGVLLYRAIENYGGMWEIYKHKPEGDTKTTWHYEKVIFDGGATLRLFKTEEFAQKAIKELMEKG